MKEKLQPPRFERESSQLFRAVGERAIDESFPIVSLDHLPRQILSTSWDDILESWEAKGFGRPMSKTDSHGETSTLWSFSDEGLAEARRLIARATRRSFWAKLKRNAVPALSLIASLAAAVAAAFSAYYSYLGLQKP